ncbi:tetratricopeptide repeat protein [Gemmata sp. JC717]|uniref:tetratricopeptide repeat protein n=1 Tax=Gemmata algarum TaxID=2975278 RepID=UPI0021BB1DBB|nr:serine/threonine-protein kinase [Gemmata algarum]MDY3556531.1 tetratricopeptide repeat protein [Gemmata algarum]
MPDDLSATRVSGPNSPHAPDSSATVARSADPLTARRQMLGEEVPAVPGYEVARELARGGMGRVLAARDLTLNRPVAIKVLLPRGGRDGARRFVTEAEITAQLPHPNIPPVYALGRFGDGTPFLVMKLIEGRTLTALLRDRASPAEELNRFVQIFEHVCLAVGFAHARGVVHRDLKPANIMVGEFGEVQVMDWGLAKTAGGLEAPTREQGAEDEPKTLGDSTRPPDVFSSDYSTEVTAAGQVLGTPSYMAPEQARGEPVDPRADVFSLGAVLCEVLTGSRPFAGRHSTEVIGATAAGLLDEPLAALAASGAPAELVELARRCLAPWAADRPADGKAVADAVARYRAGVETRLRAAEAERAAAEVKATEQRKRRRVQLALLAAVAFMLLGAAGTGWWLDHKAAERRIEAERAERDRAAADQRQSEKDARAAADNRRALAADLDRCEAALRNDDAATAALALADVTRREGQPGGEEFGERIARCRADHALLTRLDEVENFAWTPVNGLLPLAADLQTRWAAALAQAGIVPGAPPAETARRVNGSLIRDRVLLTLDLWLGAAGTADLAALLHEADPDPTRDAVRAAVQARDGAGLGRLTAAGLGDQPARFVIALAAAVRPGLSPARRRALLAAEWDRAPGSVRVLMELGGTYPMNSKEGAAERARWFQAAVALRPQSVIAWNKLGIALRDGGQYDEALAAAREALRLDPRDLNALNIKAMALRAKGDGPGAVRVYEELMRVDPNSPYPEFHNNYGTALATAGDLRGAIVKFRKALEMNPKFATAHANLGNALLRTRELDAAVQSLRAAVECDPRSAVAHADLGRALELKRDTTGAIRAYRESLKLNPADPGTASALGHLLWDREDWDGAIGAFRDALRYAPAEPGLHNNLGALLRQTGDPRGAISAHKEAIRLDPKHLRARYNLGIALRAANDPAGAVKAYRELLALDPNHSAGHNGLGNALRDLGDLDGAIAEFRAALSINPRNGPAQQNLTDTLKQKDRTAPRPREIKRS